MDYQDIKVAAIPNDDDENTDDAMVDPEEGADDADEKETDEELE